MLCVDVCYLSPLSGHHPELKNSPGTTSRQIQKSMEMWKILTQKFKAQSLDEVRPFQQSGEMDEHDSGTESDENAELQAIEEAMQSKRDQENYAPQVIASMSQFRVAGSPGYRHQSPIHSSFSPVNTVSKRPFQLVNQPNLPALSQYSPYCTGYTSSLSRDSPTENSDFERCSLDYEPGSSTEFEQHSSEEELTIINCTEKRKWSQMNRCNSCDDSSGSSDEELRDLFCEPKPLNFSSSPPKGVQKLSHTLSPTLFLANLSPKTVRLCSVSPRKRHRQMNSNDVSDATVIQRPCLDFEKMQKTLFRKHVPRGVKRIVKIRVGLLKGTL